MADDKVIGYITLTWLAKLIDRHPRTVSQWARAGDIACDVHRSRVHMRGVRYDVRVYGDGCAAVRGERVPVPRGLVHKRRTVYGPHALAARHGE